MTSPVQKPDDVTTTTSATSTQSKQKIVICGGGNAAHVFTVLCSLNPTNEVHLLSLYKTEANDIKTELNKTSDKLLRCEVVHKNQTLTSKAFNITNDPTCLNNADIVIISLPAFAHNQYLNAIKDNITPQNNKKTLVGVFPGASGLECEWQNILGNQSNFILLSCITLPWACRIKKFGQIVEILSTKTQVEVCVYGQFQTDNSDVDQKSNNIDDKSVYINKFSDIIGPLPKLIDYGHILNMSLAAMNAVAHPAIMYDKWKDYDNKPLNAKPLFYHGVTLETNKILCGLSDEVINISKSIEKETKIKLNVPHIFQWFLDVYGDKVTDKTCLYKAMLTNPGYDGLTHPMIKIDDKDEYIPNWNYRYLSEDIPYGLIVIRGLLLILDDKFKCNVPIMDSIIKWSQKVLKKEYLIYNNDGTIIAGKDINQTRAPQKYNIVSIKDLI